MGTVCPDRARASLSIGTRREVLAGIFGAITARGSLTRLRVRFFYSCAIGALRGDLARGGKKLATSRK